MTLYPVNLKIDNTLCLVVGGGSVALRKTRSLLEAGARVRVVSPEIIEGLRSLAESGKIEWLERGYATGDLCGAFLAFAATGDPDVQELILSESKERGILLNSADDPISSNFHVPAHFRRGSMLLTVSTGGGSPALARRLRQQLEKDFGVEYGAVVDLLSMIRDVIVSSGTDSAGHKEIFNRLLDQNLVGLVLAQNWFELQMMLLRELPDYCDGVELLRKFMEKHDQDN